MRLSSLTPAWVGWLVGAFLWAGIGALWFVGNTPDDMKPILVGVAALASAVHLVRAAVAFGKRHEPPKQRAPREEPDFSQLLIFALVAGVVIFSVVLSFEVLGVLGEMQR